MRIQQCAARDLSLIHILLLLAVWVGAVYRRLRQLDDNIKIAMEQIGLQLSSRFRALETLLELLRSYGPSAQLVLPPPSIHALSTPAQVLEQEQRLAQAMSYVTAVAESRPAIKADKTYQRCLSLIHILSGLCAAHHTGAAAAQPAGTDPEQPEHAAGPGRA